MIRVDGDVNHPVIWVDGDVNHPVIWVDGDVNHPVIWVDGDVNHPEQKMIDYKCGYEKQEKNGSVFREENKLQDIPRKKV